jgi:apolipoprotein N-acyltransferase
MSSKTKAIIMWCGVAFQTFNTGLMSWYWFSTDDMIGFWATLYASIVLVIAFVVACLLSSDYLLERKIDREEKEVIRRYEEEFSNGSPDKE